MKFTKEIGEILFSGYYNGTCDDSGKHANQNSVLLDFDSAFQKYIYMFGKIRPEIILTDYDTPESFECRLKIAKALHQNCVAIKSNSKGGHIYWMNRNRQVVTSNSGNKTVLTLEPVDYKCGVRLIRSTGEIKEAKNVGCICTNERELREVVYFQTNGNGELDELPWYDCPMESGTKHEFLNMGDGDGRQDGLFTFMNPVKSNGFTYDQFREVAEIIDRYVFKESLGELFENAVRKEAWETAVDTEDGFWDSKSKRFRHEVFADYLKHKYHIKKINGRIHVYQDGVYVPGYERIEQIIYSEIPSLTRTKRNEVIDCLRISCEDERPCSPNLIAFNNGLYDLNTDTLSPLTPQYNITCKIPHNYNPDAHSDLADHVLNKLACNDIDIRHLLEEVIGSCMYRDADALSGGMCAILVGEKENGKSTYIHMIETMIGEQNYSSLDFSDLGDRFSTIMLYGKLANLGDDISDKFRDDISIFKKIVTGETIKAEEKGKDPVTFKPFCTVIFSANEIPKMRDRTGAGLRRLLIVPMKAHFSKEDADYNPNIRHDLETEECMEYLIQCGLDGLMDVLQKKTYTIPSAVVQASKEYEKENNPILAFIDQLDDVEVSIVNNTTKSVFNKYKMFCYESGYSYDGLTLSKFSKEVNKALGTVSGLLNVKDKKQNRWKSVRGFIRK